MSLILPASAQFTAPSGGNGFPNQPGSAVDLPQTNLTPIASPPAAYQAPTGYGSFDPYATTNPSAAATPIPGITNNLGPGVTTIGPPIGSPMAPSLGGSTFAPPGSLFGRLFSRPASQPMPGYGPHILTVDLWHSFLWKYGSRTGDLRSSGLSQRGLPGNGSQFTLPAGARKSSLRRHASKPGRWLQRVQPAAGTTIPIHLCRRGSQTGDAGDQ